jgi:hypothetical protein
MCGVGGDPSRPRSSAIADDADVRSNTAAGGVGDARLYSALEFERNS